MRTWSLDPPEFILPDEEQGEPERPTGRQTSPGPLELRPRFRTERRGLSLKIPVKRSTQTIAGRIHLGTASSDQMQQILVEHRG